MTKLFDTKAEQTLVNNCSSILDAMSIHAQEFAEWILDSEYDKVYDGENECYMWYNKYATGYTNSELYTLFNNQTNQ
jgi:hypothetical protein